MTEDEKNKRLSKTVHALPVADRKSLSVTMGHEETAPDLRLAPPASGDAYGIHGTPFVDPGIAAGRPGPAYMAGLANEPRPYVTVSRKLLKALLDTAEDYESTGRCPFDLKKEIAEARAILDSR